MEDFVSFEIAKKLKEKGFREECLAYYTSEYTLYNNMVVLCDDKYLEVAEIDYNECLISNNSVRENKDNNTCDAPTISQVLKWLREEKKIHICIDFDGVMYWYYQIAIYGSTDIAADGYGFKLYEDAMIAGIEYVLNKFI